MSPIFIGSNTLLDRVFKSGLLVFYKIKSSKNILFSSEIIQKGLGVTA